MKYCDLHCDLLRKIKSVSEWGETDLSITPEGLSSGVILQFFAVFAPNGEATEGYFAEKVALFKEIRRRFAGAYLSVENGGAFAPCAHQAERLADAGVKIFGLVWNGGNALGGGHGQPRGLSAAGEKACETLLQRGVLIDVSHLSDAGFDRVYEICRTAKKPFLATHSDARALCAHTRNLADGQLKKIAAVGGVAGVNFYPPHLGGYSPAEHIRHIVNVAGEDTPCVGSDFDGIERGFYENCREAAERLFSDLCRAGLSERVAEKVLRKNVERIWADNG